MSDVIETAIRAEDWARTRRLVTKALRNEPDSHWLLIRLALTYYEQRRYKEALKFERRALELAPRCPLVLWDFAGTLQMLDRDAEAIVVYRRLVRRGVTRLASGECGEGRAWARGLVADSYYRLFQSYAALGRRRQAIGAFRRHAKLRGPGCRSIYRKPHVFAEFLRYARAEAV